MNVGVVGGGRMGAGIAHAFLLAGDAVTIIERDAEAAEAAVGRVREALQRSAERGATVTSAFSVSTDAADLGACDLVIEAVPEDRTLKFDALRRIEASVGDTAVIATNTSSIGVDDLASCLGRPERFLGLHFFNPVPSSLLVEVVIGSETDPALTDRSRSWVVALGKTPIVVRDAPGFASSRLGVILGLEAIRMLEEGVSSAEDIDAAMVLGYRHPMGPLRTTDVVGLDVRLAIAEELEARLGPRFAPPELLRRMVADGLLGRKSGRGFYEWSAQ